MKKGGWIDINRIVQNMLHKDIENTSNLNDGFDKQAGRRNILGNEWKNFHCVAQFFGWPQIITYSVRYGYFHNYSQSWLILHHSSQHVFRKGIKCNEYKSMCSVKLLKMRLPGSRSHWLFPLKNKFLFTISLHYACITLKVYWLKRMPKKEEKLFWIPFHIDANWFYSYIARLNNMWQESQLWPMGLKN